MLGKALVDGVEPPSGCPTYDEVMGWHSELCATVASTIKETQWSSYSGELDVSSRAKTIDTLRQKLIRKPTLPLNTVQDLAGVRVDLDCNLNEQTRFAEEIRRELAREHRSDIKDIRKEPHSGYRAVHVWLRLPAGRVEIQVRTLAQSAWANTYEQLGDLAGRHIRYGEQHADPAIQTVIDILHRLSDTLAELEVTEAEIEAADARIRNGIEEMEQIQHATGFDQIPADLAEKFSRALADEPRRRAEHQSLVLRARAEIAKYVRDLQELRRMLGGE